MEDIQDLYLDYGQMGNDKTIYLITNLKKSRGWKVYIKDNILVLDHKDFTQSQPPTIRLYDKIINNSIIYINEDPFSVTFNTENIWKYFDEKGRMKFDKEIDLKI